MESENLEEITGEEKKKFEEYAKEMSEQVLLDELSYDVYGYDLRNWDERGINEVTIKERYESCNKNFPLVSASRYFTWVLPTLKIGFKTDVVKVVEVMMASREESWKELRQYCLSDLKQGLKRYFEDPKYANKDQLKGLYEQYVRYCEVLNKKPLAKRQIFDSVKTRWEKEKVKNGF